MPLPVVAYFFLRRWTDGPLRLRYWACYGPPWTFEWMYDCVNVWMCKCVASLHAEWHPHTGVGFHYINGVLSCLFQAFAVSFIGPFPSVGFSWVSLSPGPASLIHLHLIFSFQSSCKHSRCRLAWAKIGSWQLFDSEVTTVLWIRPALAASAADFTTRLAAKFWDLVTMPVLAFFAVLPRSFPFRVPLSPTHSRRELGPLVRMRSTRWTISLLEFTRRGHHYIIWKQQGT